MPAGISTRLRAAPVSPAPANGTSLCRRSGATFGAALSSYARKSGAHHPWRARSAAGRSTGPFSQLRLAPVRAPCGACSGPRAGLRKSPRTDTGEHTSSPLTASGSIALRRLARPRRRCGRSPQGREQGSSARAAGTGTSRREAPQGRRNKADAWSRGAMLPDATSHTSRNVFAGGCCNASRAPRTPAIPMPTAPPIHPSTQIHGLNWYGK